MSEKLHFTPVRSDRFSHREKPNCSTPGVLGHRLIKTFDTLPCETNTQFEAIGFTYLIKFTERRTHTNKRILLCLPLPNVVREKVMFSVPIL